MQKTIKLWWKNLKKNYFLYLIYSPPFGKINTVREVGKYLSVEHLLYGRYYLKHYLDYYF